MAIFDYDDPCFQGPRTCKLCGSELTWQGSFSRGGLVCTNKKCVSNKKDDEPTWEDLGDEE